MNLIRFFEVIEVAFESTKDARIFGRFLGIIQSLAKGTCKREMSNRERRSNVVACPSKKCRIESYDEVFTSQFFATHQRRTTQRAEQFI